MKHKLNIVILSLTIGLLTNCADDTLGNLTDSVPSDGIELAGIRTSLDGAGAMTKGAYGAVDTVRLKDLIGRGIATTTPQGRTIDMEVGDQMVFTSIKRKEHSIPVFSYTGLVYDMQTQGAWTRDKEAGLNEGTTPTRPEKIYWSDASSGHVFVGYSCPKVTSPATFDWNEATTNSKTYYYGSIGDPTVTTIPPATDGGTETTAFIDYTEGNNLIKADDILLTWADDKTADNAVANIEYHHGLALVRVIVNISGFGANEKDKQATVTDMILKQMPTMYKWDMLGYKAEALAEADQTALDDIYKSNNSVPAYTSETPAPRWNQKKDVHLWLPTPAGEGTGANKTFTFYALAVPHMTNSLSFSFNVTYPDPMNPESDTPITRPYAATAAPNGGIEFRAGWCTTLKISLSHRNDQMTIGAEYMTWQFAATPDDGSLKKGEAFLSSSDYAKATYSEQTKDVNNKDITITIDNATWLYRDNGVLKDIYGNTGDKDHPYVIKTAAQFASFAKEVNLANYDFAGQYIRMDADFYLQKSIDVTEKGMEWPGIGKLGADGSSTGSGAVAFNGNIIGETRFIRHLYGKPLFINIGPKAHIEQFLLEEVLGITDGTGAYAEVNNGIICASKVTSPNDTPFTMKIASGTATAIGAFCGTNNGIIVGVYSLGEFDVTTKTYNSDGNQTSNTANTTSVGGIIAQNNGILAGAYSAIRITDPSVITNVSGCVAKGRAGAYDFYCSDMLTPKGTGTSMTATGKTLMEMRNQNFVGSTEDVADPDETTLNGAIKQWAKDGYTIPQDIHTYYSGLPEVSTAGVNGATETKTALQSLIEHLNSHYYTYQVAGLPWIF